MQQNARCGERAVGVLIIGSELVAETGADGDLVTALGAAAAENGGSRFGLHAGEEAVRLGTVAAIGLKRALGHGTDSNWRK
jgi:hypothetical protein